MTKRSQWCDIDKETRREVLDRDNNRCIICGSKKPLTIAHIFLNRAKGGKGCKENLVTLCINCHYYILDNPIGRDNILKSQEYLEKCKNYLIEKEHITNSKGFLDSLKFDKTSYLKQKQAEYQEKINSPIEYRTKCKDCIMLVKNKSRYTTIQSYYCKFKRKEINKNSKSCKEYKTK